MKIQKIDLLKKIKIISKNLNINTKTNDLLYLEKLILEYLKNNPKDTDMWLRLAILESKSPLEDQDKIIECSNNILSYDSTNPYALLILSYTYDFYYGAIPDHLFEKIRDITFEDKEIAAMIEIAKSWYYRSKNNVLMYEKSLLESINLANDFSEPYIDLGILYINNNKVDYGKMLILQGLANVKQFFDKDNLIAIEDLTDIQRFLNYYYKGIIARKNNMLIDRYLNM